MEDDFDVQRDHAQLISDAAALLAPDGLIVFSNNFTRFKIDPLVTNRFHVEDISRPTLPWDFRRNPRIHTCFLLRQKAV
jgi:23S rRNA (guanine2445-N2)-methyltransferase / 23S rRNA (guanine2069-N7)-methyltransferase